MDLEYKSVKLTLGPGQSLNAHPEYLRMRESGWTVAAASMGARDQAERREVVVTFSRRKPGTP